MLKGVVVGSGRSGTSLRVNLLGSHPNLSPMYELEFLTHVVNWFRETKQIISRDLLGLLYPWGSMQGGLPFDEKRRQKRPFRK